MFTSADRERCRAIFDAPDSDVARLVWADTLLERGEVLGELIRLQCQSSVDTEARAEALLTELRPRFKHELYPYALHVAVERGLPFAAQLDPERLIRASDALKDPPWPLRRVTLSAEAPGSVYASLQAPLFDFVERLDLGDSSFWSPYTQFVDGTPATCRVLPRLKHLTVPRDFLPAHWVPVLGPAFAHVRVLVVHANGEALAEWFQLLPKLETLELLVDRRGVSPGLRETAVAFVEGDRRRTLRVNGMEVTPAHLDRALPAPGLEQAELADIASPPVGKVARVEVHGVLVPEVPIVDATLNGARGVWLELPSRRTSFRGRVGQRHDVRLAMLAPRHAHVVGAHRVVENEEHTWLLLDEALQPFRAPRGAKAALRAARELASGLEALRGFMQTHAADVAWPFPLTEGELLQRPDGSVAVLLPRPHHFPSKRSQPSLGVPVSCTDRGLVLFVGWVLAQWLGVKLPVIRETQDTDVLFEQSMAVDRFLEAPTAGALEPGLVKLLEGCWSPRQSERFSSLVELRDAL